MNKVLHFQYWSGTDEFTLFLRDGDNVVIKLEGVVEKNPKEALILLEEICERYNNDLEKYN